MRLGLGLGSARESGGIALVNTSLSTAVGPFIETGNTAGLRAQRKTSATVGVFTETGNATGLRSQRKTSTTVGVFTETGNAASFSKAASPSAIAGLSIWLDFAATYVTKDGSNRVSAVTNRGSGGNAAQGTGGNQPLWVASAQNGLPGLSFDGSRWMDGIMTGFTDCTVIAAMQVDSGNTVSIDCVPTALVTYTGVKFYHGAATSYFFRVGDSGASKASDAGTKVRTGDSSASTGHIWIDQSAGGAGGAIAQASLDNYTIGANAAHTEGMTGTILEVCIYDSVLSAGDRDYVEDFLKAKYSI